MSNVFLGNPASTFSSFIGQSRKALGFNDTYTYMAKNENGEWVRICDDMCMFGVGAGNGNGKAGDDGSKGYFPNRTKKMRVSGLRFSKTHRLSAAEWGQHKEGTDATRKIHNLALGKAIDAKPSYF